VDQVFLQRPIYAGKLTKFPSIRCQEASCHSRGRHCARSSSQPQTGESHDWGPFGRLKTDYQINHKKTFDDLEARCRLHLVPFFGKHRASNLSTDEIRRYIQERQKRGAANGTINRELTALKRAYSLATLAGKLLWKPHIPMLAEDNVRQGFFELPQFFVK
jgi:hypothetical protein